MSSRSNLLRSNSTYTSAHDDGRQTPALEERSHPIDLWNTGRSDNSTFASQLQAVEEGIDNLRRRDVQVKNKDSSETAVKEIHLPWRERLRHTTWAYFTFTMATGGLANVINSVPFQAKWLHYIGLCFFFLNLALYVLLWAMILTRFLSFPSTFRASLVHPTESLFVPAVAVSFGTICITIVEYGADSTGQWLTEVTWVLFWFNVALSFILSITVYMILWSSLTFTIAQMTPIWIFPAYPLLIIGPHAANLAAKLESSQRALECIVGGFTVQGIGFLVSMTIYSAFVYRLMTQKLPADPSRPGMFVSVGPAAFTCSGIIGMASTLPRAIGTGPDATFMQTPSLLAGQIVGVVGNWMALWLWGLALWFFFVSAISNIAPLYTHRRHPQEGQPKNIPFAMTWFSYVFPQTALTTATFRVADVFNIHALQIIGCVMTGILVAMWIFVVVMMIRAIHHKQILWPEKGEDREEGGYKRPVSKSKRAKQLQDIEENAFGGVSNTIDVGPTGAGTQRPNGSIVRDEETTSR